MITERGSIIFLARGTAASRTRMLKIIGMKMRRRKQQQTGTSPNKWTQWVQLAHKSKEQSGSFLSISYAGRKNLELK